MWPSTTEQANIIAQHEEDVVIMLLRSIVLWSWVNDCFFVCTDMIGGTSFVECKYNSFYMKLLTTKSRRVENDVCKQSK